jgi:predicted PurR-regulated permease PerM
LCAFLIDSEIFTEIQLEKRYWFLLIMILLGLLVLYESRRFIEPFVVAFFLAYAINPLVDWIESKGARRDYAIFTVYLVVFIVAALVLGMIIPRIIQDLAGVSRKTPSILKIFQNAGEFLNQLNRKVKLPFDLHPIGSELARRGEIWVRSFLVQVAQAILGLFSQTFLMLLIPLLSYYISRDYPQLKRRGFDWLLRNFGPYWTRTFLKIDAVFHLYIRGQLLVTFIVGALISLGLSLLGFEAAFLLGAIAGIFNLIPYFGPVLGAIPVIILGLLKSPWLVLYVILLFIAVNQIEVMFLTPRIIGGKLGLHPVVVVFLVLLGGSLFKILGMIFAVPIGALILIIFSSVYEICFEATNQESIPSRSDLKPEKPD